MDYLSVCSGIEAASVAWHPLGWNPAAFSEIEPFPCAVLRHHYPNVPNLGDMTRYVEWPQLAPDVLVGGTPCQSFSVAGLRKGLADPRGNLALVFLGLVDRFRPRWVLWENVPGVRSADDGQALGAFLGGLGELGYGWAYRSLDAQYFGLAQRRERVFVVGHSGGWTAPTAVLFEPESLSGDSAPRRETGERVAPTIEGRASAGGGGWGTDFLTGGGMTVAIKGAAIGRAPENGPQYGEVLADGSCYTLNCTEVHAVTHALRADGFDASEDGTGRGTPIIAFSQKDHGADAGDLAPTLRSMGHERSHANGGGQVAVAIRTAQTTANGHGIADDVAHTLDGANGQAVAFVQNQRDEVRVMEVAGALAKESGMKQQTYLATTTAVRRLTPRECERLQGFPDDYTLVPHRGKPAADGPRYRALGNSMAVPVIRWLGQRMQMVDAVVCPPQNPR